MPLAVVRVTPWLEAQTLLGETVPDRWRRVCADAGLDAVVTQDPSQLGDLVIDGRVLALASDRLAAAARHGRALVLSDARAEHTATDAGDDRTVPRLDLDALHAYAALVILAPGLLGQHVGTFEPVSPASDLDPFVYAPVTNLVELRSLEARLLAERHARETEAGVRFVGEPPFLGPAVVLEPGCTVWSGCVLLGSVTVCAGAVVRAGCHLVDTYVGPGADLWPYTVCEGARIGAGARVGPFAHVRPGSVFDDGVRVGNFVETKKTHLHPGATVGHLTYLGDATVGAGTNIGAGTITCNYDGGAKHRTHIGAGAFVGTHSSLVAPVSVGDGALVAAGSVITADVPDGALAVGRGEQRVIEGKGGEILARNKRRAEQDG